MNFKDIGPFWCLSETYTVTEAAALLALVNPLSIDPSGEYFRDIETGLTDSNGITDVKAAETMLIRAINANSLKACRIYDAEPKYIEGIDIFYQRSYWGKEDVKCITGSIGKQYVIRVVPNWSKTTVHRDDLVAWLKSRGLRSGFFFSDDHHVPACQSTPAPAADSALLEKVQQLEAQNAVLMQQVAALERQLEQASATPEKRRWPWGNHTTPELEILREIAPLFWADGKIEDETDVPTNEEFAAKLIEHDLPKHKANSLASMFRPSDMPTGRRRKG